MKIGGFARKFHIYASVFFLPMAVIFVITGITYIFGFNQNIGASKQKWVLDKVVPKENQLDFLIGFMKENNIVFPDDIDARAYRGALLIGTAKYDITLEVKEKKTTIETTKRTLLGTMIMLHKSKGKWYFNALSVVFGIFLILLYMSGLIMAYKNTFKKVGLSFIAGLITTIFLAYISS